MYNYNYQGQELQETGFYSFKWREYMPDIGRFTQIDPLSEKFPYNSTYAFAENRGIDGRELEGLEWIEFMPFLFENTGVKPILEPLTKPEVVENIAKTEEASESLTKTSEGMQKSNERVKYENNLERAKDKMEGIERAQENLKKSAERGFKQNRIQSTKKSEQNLLNALRRLDPKDLDEFDVKVPPVKKDNLVVPKPEPVIPNFDRKKEKPKPSPAPPPKPTPPPKRNDNIIWS